MSFLLEKPVFIMAAPRSGSTLLFEALAASPAIWTIGGEWHHIIKGIPELRPGTPGVISNRLTEQHASDSVVSRLYQRFLGELRNTGGRRLLDCGHAGLVRMLEKTPKNALRIPLINRVFPDAYYIYLYRDPRANIGSIIDAWLSGRWVTYRGLPGWNGAWSLLLPPGWQQLWGKSIAEVAAFQWESANRYILDDLSEFPSNKWVAVSYEDFVRNPGKEVERICEKVQFPFDDVLMQRTGNELPLSRYTLTAPRPDKWRRYEREILSVLPSVMPLWERITDAGGKYGVCGSAGNG
jgi:hypothetical protein